MYSLTNYSLVKQDFVILKIKNQTFFIVFDKKQIIHFLKLKK